MKTQELDIQYIQDHGYLIGNRCKECGELRECEYCYVCDGGEYKKDQIALDFRGEHHEVLQYISYVEMGEEIWEHLYK